MYPLSRNSAESQRTMLDFKFHNSKNIVTADFQIPMTPDYSAKEVKPDLEKVLSRCQINSSTRNNPDHNELGASFFPDMVIRLAVGEDKWKLDGNFKGLRSLNTTKNSQLFTFVKITVHFRSKYFGSWEPFEYIKQFVVEISDKSVDNSVERIEESIFTAEQLEATLASYKKKGDLNLPGKFILEMTMIVEGVSFSEEEESLLSAQAVKMNNALVETPPKSDFRIKVEDEEYFVHLKQIQAFSCVSDALSKYVEKCDWSDLLSPESMQALLRFIYYCEVDTIITVEVAFELLRFGHLYQVPALFKVCQGRLMTFDVFMFSLVESFDIYMFARIPDEFQQLKQHFCRLLSENAADYDAAELKQLAKRNEDGSGLDALVEILQFVADDEDDEDDDPPTN